MSPFDAFGAEDAALLDRNGYLQLHRPAPPLRRHRRRLPSGLVALIESCLRPEPEERPSTRQLWQALNDILAELEPPGTDDEPDEELTAFD
jgi:hypothetical protein